MKATNPRFPTNKSAEAMEAVPEDTQAALAVIPEVPVVTLEVQEEMEATSTKFDPSYKFS